MRLFALQKYKIYIMIINKQYLLNSTNKYVLIKF